MSEKLGDCSDNRSYVNAGFVLWRKGRSLIMRCGAGHAGEADRARGHADPSPVEAVNAWIRRHNGGKVLSASGG
jgi:hypothetical protein